MKMPLLLSTVAMAMLLNPTGATTTDAFVATDTTVTAPETGLRVNTESSTLKWNAKKFGGEHYGTIRLAEGTLLVNGSKLTGGSFTIDMTSIVVEDITRADSNKKLTDHLKSDDFFSVDKFNTSTFKITKATPIAKAKKGQPNYTITGDLTIKGITKPITFPAIVNVTGKTAEAEANIEVDRTKYDIKYRSGLMGTAADKIIDDTFTISLKLNAGSTIQPVSGK